jgi:hypothetical protein
VIADPIAKNITHVVVEESRPPQIDRLVPVESVVDTVDSTIYLNCSRQELVRMVPLIEAEFLWGEIPGFTDPAPTSCTHMSFPAG